MQHQVLFIAYICVKFRLTTWLRSCFCSSWSCRQWWWSPKALTQIGTDIWWDLFCSSRTLFRYLCALIWIWLSYFIHGKLDVIRLFLKLLWEAVLFRRYLFWNIATKMFFVLRSLDAYLFFFLIKRERLQRTRCVLKR